MKNTFELSGKYYTTDEETVKVLRSIIDSAKENNDSSAVIAVIELGIKSGRIFHATKQDAALEKWIEMTPQQRYDIMLKLGQTDDTVSLRSTRAAMRKAFNECISEVAKSL
jgi:hypothetical protein